MISIAAPDIRGRVKLSSMPKGKNSTREATSDPNMSTINGGWGRKKEIDTHMPRQARLPSIVFSVSRRFLPHLTPIICAAVSPKARKNNTAIATHLSKKYTDRKAATT